MKQKPKTKMQIDYDEETEVHNRPVIIYGVAWARQKFKEAMFNTMSLWLAKKRRVKKAMKKRPDCDECKGTGVKGDGRSPCLACGGTGKK